MPPERKPAPAPDAEVLLARLTGKQRLFVEAYFRCNLNATRAAVAAGYSEKTARSIASENLSKPDIRAAISARVAQAAMGADEVLLRLAEHARCDIADFLDIPKPDAELTPVELAQRDADRILAKRYPDMPGLNPDLPRLDLQKAQALGLTHLVKSFKPGEFGIEVTLVDSQAALREIGRHHGLFKDRVEQTGQALDLLRDLLTAPLEDDADEFPPVPADPTDEAETTEEAAVGDEEGAVGDSA